MLSIKLFNIASLHLYIVLILCLFNIFVLYLLNLKVIKNYQLNAYNFSKTYNCLIANHFSDFMPYFNFTILSFCSMFLFNAIIFLIFKNSYLTYLSLFFYLLFAYYAVKNILKNKNSKNKLVFTKRMIRFLIVFSFANFILTLLSFYLSYTFSNFFLCAALSLTPILSLVSFLVAHLIIMPIEILIGEYYKVKARKKLKKYKKLKIIAITGSFGKTSVKNILFTILSKKFNVQKTPNSFNTEMGICKFINNSDFSNCDYLILEMGADRNHDILKLCKIAKPNHAILTGINNQHLETFKTQENIINTKYELIENTQSGGILIFNGENEICKNLYDKTDSLNKHLISINKNDNFYVKNTNYKNGAMNFTICFNEKECINVSTKLLGKHNVLNIMLASFMAYCLKEDINLIKKGIEALEPIPHRLELIKQNGLNIIDDSFNSNPTGSKEALKVLNEFNSDKIVITPGLVELGIYQPVENEVLGEEIGKVADFVYIVNKTNKEALMKGLKNSKIDLSKIKYFDSLNETQEDLKQNAKIGDTILFLNDLPDNYN